MIKNQKFITNAADLPECIGDLSAVKDALYAIGGKWKLPILMALFGGNQRFNELLRGVIGISSKILSNELKDLEENGFIQRKVIESYPLVVEYELKPYSYTLLDVVIALSEWGLMHREKLKNEFSS
ncbi:transcriptional regulator [Siphonobacter sp. BAB-5385]|uniref:winged helix-turn-helix transcriptional regulator n=1 Tax=unclassified Siphonobacter TaxID=2635712 RepID=UPI000B9E9293|nr:MULTISPECIES: helix-turn-helix domain-containing protein [unclassified Siphonobacter]OZI05735.1 transcriptional regulator [Siphonobacter sp. BAB-5385]PMD87116.1 transcriptional regulator [Siphonobacter sp. BAB-5405]